MDIGIIGSGQIGGTLARRLTELGHRVSVANSRGPASLTELAADTGATPATVEDAATAKDIVIVSIPQAAVLKLHPNLLTESTAIIVDTGNYYPARDGNIEDIEGGMNESEWVARSLGRPVIKAFNNIAANSLATRGVAAGTPGRICLPVAGDDPRAKEIVIDLIDELGFDGADAGTLVDSWRQQPCTPVYAQDFDAEAVETALQNADPDKVASYRAAADEAARAWFQN
ncbi:MAG TPA: NAD(P)-binding domain-containing protein [Pyrinomonadaceae bacterium]|nr:NAD(P)-binding domain-containing protein [Pyrinomonadaceae bacterium]